MTQTQPIKLKGFGPDETVENLITDRPIAGSSVIIDGNCYYVDWVDMPSGLSYKLCNDEGKTLILTASKARIVFEILKLADRNNELL